jgi:hypothetical protein
MLFDPRLDRLVETNRGRGLPHSDATVEAIVTLVKLDRLAEQRE